MILLLSGHRYPSDDINKFLWMVRIGGGVFPEIKEKDYLGQGNYRVDSQAGKVGSSQCGHRKRFECPARGTYKNML